MLETRPQTEALPPRQRSAVTNKRRKFIIGDGNSAWARRQRDLVTEYLADLGGRDQVSTIKFGIVNAAAMLHVELEQFAGRLSLGQTPDVEVIARVAGHHRRLCETLGLDRVATDVTPRLTTYLAQKAAEQPAEPEAEAPAEEQAA